MAAIHELLKQVSDPALRARLTEEINRVTQNKKFGLVFEEHMPEYTPLYGIGIKRGSTVARRECNVDETYTVIAIDENEAICLSKSTRNTEKIMVSELVVVGEFGDPIFPCLQSVDRVENNSECSLWHMLIEADNYHALQLLEYTHSGKVDCIYIDPPYNTGNDEWKYNDAFVDSADRWAHSKWLSMMKRRLLLAKRLLTEDGVLVISIGYHELNQLTLLCEEIFPDRQIVPVTVQTSGGKPAGGFDYLQEYLIFVTAISFKPQGVSFSGGKTRTPFEGLTLATFDQTQRPNQTYPIFIDKNTKKIVGCGKSLSERIEEGLYCGDTDDFAYDYDNAPQDAVAIWPITSKGDRCVWRLISSRLMNDWEKGYIKVSDNRSKNSKNRFSIQYLPEGVLKKIETGELSIIGHEENAPTLILSENKTAGTDIPTIWIDKRFYTTKGTAQLVNIFGKKEFKYPKPVDLIADIIRACTDNNSIIVDFFAGSGTTLNAVNLVNEESNGCRQCIMITNNEVSKKQSEVMKKANLKPGDDKWEEQGICRSITWPRTVYTILGKRYDGTPIEGNYTIDSFGFEKPMSDGFEANCEYFRLGFLDKDQVSLGRQFKEILPLLWMKAGAIGRRPEIEEEDPVMLILPENHFAVLVEEAAYSSFAKEIKKYDNIDMIFFVTNSESAYHEMAADIGVKNTYQLYRDYIENFMIGARRDRA